MSSTRRHPLRNTRKRKRLNGTDENSNSHYQKRRKTMEFKYETKADGFCNYCTNPYKLICCKQCYRSWHINCLSRYLLNDATNEAKNENQSQMPLKPITNNNKNQKNIAKNTNKNGKENENKSQIQNKGKKSEINKNITPSPIELTAMPSKQSNQSKMEYLTNINKWIQSITANVMKHTPLFHDTHKKQIIAIFTCIDCVNNTHKCFICKKREDKCKQSPILCSHGSCGKYYHISCLKDNKHYCKHTKFYKYGGINCPAHHCWECFQNPHSRKLQVSFFYGHRACWYCPRAYHRNCAPLTAVLMSAQKTHSEKEIQAYPGFRFDLITCCWNDLDKANIEDRLVPSHPKPADLQFGRNDCKAGIFRWQLWNGQTAKFWQLFDDPFSINVRMKNDYKMRKSKKKWRKGFTQCNKLKYLSSEIISLRKKKKKATFDYGQCSCVNGCSLDWSCTNYSMDIECNDKICGAKDFELCENRQFMNTKPTDNVKIKKTKNKCGFGAFARRDIRANQLVIEYVGEVITKQESNERIHKLNDEKTKNFYHFQFDAKTVIDGTIYGNESRFINHSCSPNCYTLKWDVSGEHRLGVFALVNIKKGTELNYDYQYEVPNVDDMQHLAKCLCGAKECRIYLGWNKKKAKEWKRQQKEIGNYKSDSDSDY